ncbi:hypothetical protein [Burkholderia stagnalis]|uniref:hypothetical protein n=1 Tax=Burkholderia stagnalis TaxID=1503054 RepID=UPI00075A59DD|nr:hypothetical protein [Burkholderia stagnalis]KVL93087.1 hypothetical protein WT03_18960 [Burkholderia stagnalis]
MKSIFYPGNHGQTCQAQYAICLRNPEGSILSRAEVLFVEAENGGNPGGTFCSFGETPSYLVDKVLSDELAGCRIEFVDVYYAGAPDDLGRRTVYRWAINADLDDFVARGGRHDVLSYASGWDRLKAKLGRHVTPAEYSVYSVDVVGGTCRIKVDPWSETLSEDERLAMLNRFGVLSR